MLLQLLILSPNHRPAQSKFESCNDSRIQFKFGGDLKSLGVLLDSERVILLFIVALSFDHIDQLYVLLCHFSLNLACF